MPLPAGEPDEVDDPGDAEAGVESDHEAKKEGHGAAIECLSTDFEQEDFDCPGNEDGEGGVADHLHTGNGISQGCKRPPGEAVAQEGEDAHDGGTNAHKEEAFEIGIEWVEKFG